MFTASRLFKEDAFNFLKYTLEKINKNKYKIEKYEGVYDYRILKDEEVMIEFSLDESFFLRNKDAFKRQGRFKGFRVFYHHRTR